jgi:hypothetical protein
MQYKVELKYFSGWDDAGWTEEMDGVTKPQRFGSIREAQAELEEFFADVKAAVTSGDMDTVENPEDYRIVKVNA